MSHPGVTVRGLSGTCRPHLKSFSCWRATMPYLSSAKASAITTGNGAWHVSPRLHMFTPVSTTWAPVPLPGRVLPQTSPTPTAARSIAHFESAPARLTSHVSHPGARTRDRSPDAAGRLGSLAPVAGGQARRLARDTRRARVNVQRYNRRFETHCLCQDKESYL